MSTKQKQKKNDDDRNDDVKKGGGQGGGGGEKKWNEIVKERIRETINWIEMNVVAKKEFQMGAKVVGYATAARLAVGVARRIVTMKSSRSGSSGDEGASGMDATAAEQELASAFLWRKSDFKKKDMMMAAKQMGQLEMSENGTAFEPGPESGVRVTPGKKKDESAGSFEAPFFFSQLRTNVLGNMLLTAATSPSTQDVFQSEVSRLPAGAVFVADRQVKGRGRGGNVWTSPEGCLMFSLKTEMRSSIAQAGVSEQKRTSFMPPGQLLPFVQYVITMSIVDAVRDVTRGALKLRIKWPNDIYTADGTQKIGGVLSWSTAVESRFHVVIGVGLNVDNEEPTTCINSLLRETENTMSSPGAVTSVTREKLLAHILGFFEQYMDILLSRGFEPLQTNYLGSWLHTNQRVTVVDEAVKDDAKMLRRKSMKKKKSMKKDAAAEDEAVDEEDEPEEIEGVKNVTIVGLTPTGYLRAVHASGEQYELHPDGNSLDFFSGLISKKIK